MSADPIDLRALADLVWAHCHFTGQHRCIDADVAVAAEAVARAVVQLGELDDAWFLRQAANSTLCSRALWGLADQYVRQHPGEAPWNSKNHGVCFGVFAYQSNYRLAKLAEVVNEELSSVERDLWPNMFYVVGEGMLIPADHQARIPMDTETMFTGAEFCTVDHMALVPSLDRSLAYPFLWFLTNIIDHCIAQTKVRESPLYKQYWLRLFRIHAAIFKEAQ